MEHDTNDDGPQSNADFFFSSAAEWKGSSYRGASAQCMRPTLSLVASSSSFITRRDNMSEAIARESRVRAPVSCAGSERDKRKAHLERLMRNAQSC